MRERPNSGRRSVPIALAATLLSISAMAGCSSDPSAPPDGPARLSSSPDAVRSPLPCRTVSAILEMDPAGVEELYGSATPLPPDDIVAPGTDGAMDGLRTVPDLAEALAPGRHEVIRSWVDGGSWGEHEGMTIHVAFDPPVDLPPSLGVASEGSGAAVFDEQGNPRWDPDASAEVFSDVAAADLNLDGAGRLANVVPSPRPVWCWMTFDPDGGILLDRGPDGPTDRGR